MFDTHTHLNFQAFEGRISQIVQTSKEAGVDQMVVVGTDISTSKKAVRIAKRYDNIYAAVGIHPHHIFEHHDTPQTLDRHLQNLEQLVSHDKVIAIGETGVDRHLYVKTKHVNYQITEHFIALQKQAFVSQIKFALNNQKSLIIHNREAAQDTLDILSQNWDDRLRGRTVFHMCEPDGKLLDFAKKHKIFIGIGGDVTYDTKKQEFVKRVPLDLLVLETDSPYYPPFNQKGINTPASLVQICGFITSLRKIRQEELQSRTDENGLKLYSVK